MFFKTLIEFITSYLISNSCITTTMMKNENYIVSHMLIDEIKDNLDIYDRIVEEEIYREEELPEEISNHLNRYQMSYESPGEALTQLSKEIAYQRYNLKEKLSEERMAGMSSIHEEYRNIEDQLWEMPAKLEQLEKVPNPHPPIARIITGQEKPEFNELDK